MFYLAIKYPILYPKNIWHLIFLKYFLFYGKTWAKMVIKCTQRKKCRHICIPPFTALSFLHLFSIKVKKGHALAAMQWRTQVSVIKKTGVLEKNKVLELPLQLKILALNLNFMINQIFYAKSTIFLFKTCLRQRCNKFYYPSHVKKLM